MSDITCANCRHWVSPADGIASVGKCFVYNCILNKNPPMDLNTNITGPMTWAFGWRAKGGMDANLETSSERESDPTGRSQHQPGAKLDAGKPRPALVIGGFSRALSAVTDVGTYGANKYTPDGWRSVPNGVERYSEAMMRHCLKEQQGIKCDGETNLLHAAHLAWNALARLELMLLEQEQK